jgi:hypothetical protein
MRSCRRWRLAGKPVRTLLRARMCAIARSAASFTRSSKNTVPRSRPIWRHRPRYCRAVSSGNSRSTSNAVVWSTVSCGYAATAVASNTELPSAAKGAVFVRAAAHGRRLQGCRRQGEAGDRAESAALLTDEVFPEQRVRQSVLSFPYPLRSLFASRPAIMGQVLGIAYRGIATHLIRKTGFSPKTAQADAVTLIQRFGSALNLNIHLMCKDARMPRAHG